MIGTKLGHYEITGKLGSGGMGDVYRAKDTKLDRDVALKVLPRNMAEDEDRRMRFEREAKAVAALNHPNIVTIHAVEDIDGHHFLAMELVEGKPLSDLLAQGAMSLERILDIAVPLTEAMTAAHAKGITHRDLKPANIMLAEDGQLKVLDFGLAKLYEGPDPSENMTIAADSKTQEGRILGTVSYMSPEQAEGKTVGPESDVFSLGVVLFEMATGDKPFKGDTAISTLSAILREDPPSVTDLKDNLPRHLSRIIKRCLAKAPDRRYQTARDLRNDLLELREELTSGELLLTGSDLRRAAPKKTSRFPKWAMGLVGILAVIGGYYLVSNLEITTTQESSPTTSQDMEVTRMTSTGKSVEAAISPDGRYVAHVIRDQGKFTLMVTQVNTMSSVEIVPKGESSLWDPTFSPDGDFIFYLRLEQESAFAELYRIPVLGGTPLRIIEDINSTVSFSPDGTRFAYLRNNVNGSSAELVVADLDGQNIRVVAERQFPEPITEGPSWSPDGSMLAAPVVSVREGITASIVGFDVETGEETPIMPPREWMQISEIVWHPDGKSIIFNGADGLVSLQLFEVSYPSGNLRRITNDVNQYNGVGLTADGKILVAGIDEPNYNIWVSGLGPGAPAEQVTDLRKGAFEVEDWTEDYLLAVSNEDGAQILRMKPDGSEMIRVTNDHLNFMPTTTPNGDKVIFTSNRGGGINLWQVDIAGGAPVQVSDGLLETEPRVSSDGKWLVYMAGGTSQSIYRKPLDGGPAEALVATPANVPRISPDGSLVAYRAFDPEASRVRTFVIPIEGGDPVYTLDISSALHEWAPDGQGIAYVKTTDGVGNVWVQPLDGGEPRQLTYYTEDRITSFVFSPDGTQIAAGRGLTTSDVILIRDFR